MIWPTYVLEYQNFDTEPPWQTYDKSKLGKNIPFLHKKLGENCTNLP